MDKNFQLHTLGHFCKTLEFQELIKEGYSDLFDYAEYAAIFELLQGYNKEHNVQPSQVDLIQYLFDQNEIKPIKEKSYEKIQHTIKLLYSLDLDINVEVARKKIIEFIQYKKSKGIIIDYATKLKEGVEVYKRMRNELDKVVKLEDYYINKDSGVWVNDLDLNLFNPEFFEGTPSPFQGLNSLMNAGGFSSPELVIFVAGAKFGKTAFLLNLALWHWMCGDFVYYADGENGEKALNTRFYQILLDCEEKELLNTGNQALLKELIKFYNYRQGKLRLKTYTANVHCMNDVNNDMDKIEAEFGIKFKVGFWDYLDLFAANNYAKRGDKRVNIQSVYHDCIGLQKSRDMFGYSLSQINKKGVITDKKPFYTEADLEEDFGKTKNAHAVFGIPQTPKEEKANVARIHPISNRRGKKTGICFLEMDRARGYFNEISKGQALKRLKKVK